MWGNIEWCQTFEACRILSALLAFSWLGWLVLSLLLGFSLLFSFANKGFMDPSHGRWNPRESHYPDTVVRVWFFDWGSPFFFLSFFHLQFCLEKLYYRLGGQRKLDGLVFKNYSKSREFYSSHAPHAAGLSYYLFFPCFIVLTILWEWCSCSDKKYSVLGSPRGMLRPFFCSLCIYI